MFRTRENTEAGVLPALQGKTIPSFTRLRQNILKILRNYGRYYNEIRTASVNKDVTMRRPLQRTGNVSCHDRRSATLGLIRRAFEKPPKCWTFARWMNCSIAFVSGHGGRQQ